MKFTKKDLAFSVVTGLITGFFAWRILDFLNAPEFYGINWSLLVIIVPILWIIGVNLGYFLGKWLPFFNQFGKFTAIGFTNAAIDFGALNLLIALSGIAAGIWYSVFKAASFLAAVIPSYFWNKYWAFESRKGGGVVEFGKFMSVSVLAILVNNIVASFVVNYTDPFLGMSPEAWANIGAIAGSGAALVFSFLGFKKAVFKK